jgi:hypothetical protein
MLRNDQRYRILPMAIVFHATRFQYGRRLLSSIMCQILLAAIAAMS